MTALADIKVLDLSRVLAGPWCTQLLADLGATVFKVERPGEGDDTRSWGPPYFTGADGQARMASYFMSANRGKHSVAIDIAQSEGAALIRALAELGDIYINDAFSCAHRAHASTEALARLLPSAAGRLMQDPTIYDSVLAIKAAQARALQQRQN